jgi:hypothetical protein
MQLLQALKRTSQALVSICNVAAVPAAFSGMLIATKNQIGMPTSAKPTANGGR